MADPFGYMPMTTGFGPPGLNSKIPKSYGFNTPGSNKQAFKTQVSPTDVMSDTLPIPYKQALENQVSPTELTSDTLPPPNLSTLSVDPALPDQSCIGEFAESPFMT